jgi:hypothetical protein
LTGCCFSASMSEQTDEGGIREAKSYRYSFYRVRFLFVDGAYCFGQPASFLWQMSFVTEF